MMLNKKRECRTHHLLLLLLRCQPHSTAYRDPAPGSKLCFSSFFTCFTAPQTSVVVDAYCFWGSVSSLNTELTLLLLLQNQLS